MGKIEFITKVLKISGFTEIEKVEIKGVRWEVVARHKDHFNCGSVSIATSEGFDDLLAMLLKEIYITPGIEFSFLNVSE